MSHSLVDTTADDGVLWLTLDRPDARNALNADLVAELRDALDAADRDSAVRVVILRGRDGHFCAGGDIDAFDGGVAHGHRFVGDVIALFRLVERMNKPVIAFVEGYALGGGTELALACDIVFASETAVFGLPEATIGAVPGYGIVRLGELVGRARAKELMWSGRRFSAEEAALYGLVLDVRPAHELEADVLAFARRVAELPRMTTEVIKASVNRSIADATWVDATTSAALFWGTDDIEEGRRAFFDKRPPRFKDS